MKIALCISGLLREFKTCHVNLMEKLILPNKEHDFDIFVSVSDNKIKAVKPQPGHEGSFIEMCKLYKPKAALNEPYDIDTRTGLYRKHKIEKYVQHIKDTSFPKRTDGRWKTLTLCGNCLKQGKKDINKCRVCGGPLIHNMIDMQFNIFKVNELRKIHESTHQMQYDLVFRHRFDNYFIDEIKLSEVPSDTIVIPAGFDNFDEFGRGVNDQIAWGSGEVMDVYSDYVYENMHELFMESYNKHKVGPTPHFIMWLALTAHSIKIERPLLRYILYSRIPKFMDYVSSTPDAEYPDIRI